MVAESNSARRPAVYRAARILRRRTSTPLAAVLVGLVVAACGVVLPVGGVPSAAAQPKSQTTEESAARLTVTPATLDPLTPDDDLQLIITIENTTTSALQTGQLDVYLARRALTTRVALENWLAADESTNRGDMLASEPDTPTVPAGATISVPVTVPAESVTLGPRNNWGARGIAATLQTGNDAELEGRGTFVWFLDDEITPVNLGLVMPLTTPRNSTGLISAEELADYTSSTGPLTRRLDSIANRQVAIAIDPMIIASIRILGSAAPDSAVAWLERLRLAGNETFPLQYADADLSVQAQAGATEVLEPIAFDHAIDPALFTEPAPAEAGVEPNLIAAVPPTSAELVDWNYTRTDVAWPRAATVAGGDMKFLSGEGLSTTILSETNVTRSEIPTPNAVVALPGGTGVVTTDALSAAISTAVTATTDSAWREAVAEASSRLAVISAEDPGMVRTVLAAFDRDWSGSGDRTDQTLNALQGVAWETPASMQAVLGAAPASDVNLQSRPVARARLARVEALLDRNAELNAFATALSTPQAVTAPERLRLLALLGNSWADAPQLWTERVAANLALSTDTLSAVTITTRGPVNVVGSTVPFPITLNNTLDQAVNVRMRVVPTNGRLIVDSDLETTIDANSARAVTVPVSAAVGNGDVALVVTLFTPDGTVIGDAVPIEVNVQADWEGLGAGIFAGFVVLFFGFGVWRNIVRRRRERADPDSVEPDPGAVLTPSDEPVAGQPPRTPNPSAPDASTPHPAGPRG
ncbi:MAG: DUF6049 family protein [Cryobacterium sp.]